ncbi:MAG TPA: P-loop NTPase [bacterium]|nr:P-loop NTPase [bacterium]
MSDTTSEVLGGVRDVVAIHSAKGGVGKSTVAANLAVTLARLGLQVGLLDADVHGPSIAHMLGSDAHPAAAPDGERVLPVEHHGVRYLSLGNLATPDAPIIWRGPMVAGALQQFFTNVDWGDLDVLLVDLPPGTGDAILSLAQMVVLSGAVVVTTPQEMSLADTRRGIAAFQALKVPILGLIENMSVFECDACHTRTALFGEGGGQTAAQTLGIPFLGRLPILTALREAGDEGEPLAHRDPSGTAGRAFDAIARSLLHEIAEESRRTQGAFEIHWQPMNAKSFLEAPSGPPLPPATSDLPSRPVRFWQASDDTLGIAWSDGRRTFHRSYELRMACRCALCIEEWTGRTLPSLESVPRDVRPVLFRSLGRYAIQPEWSDGHRSGIYSFDELHRGAGLVREL